MNRIDFLFSVKNIIQKNPTCVEIGVHQGGFAKYIYDILLPNKLYLIDPWENGGDKNSPKKTYSGALDGWPTAYSNDGDLRCVTNLFLNNSNVIIKKGFSYDIVDEFSDEYFDFIYIDATHIYESVKADLTMFLPKLKPNGLICGHDYGNDYNKCGFGVIEAVDEFILENNGKIILQSSDNDFAIKF